MSTKQVIVRFPPSPTGFFHIGSARTALFNYLFARKHGGKLILRFEDTDKERSKKEYEEDIKSGLSWLGISFDEEYRQSERTEMYTAALKRLVDEDKAYISNEPAKNGVGEVAVVRLRNPGKKITFTDIVRGEITFDTTELGDMVIARSMSDPLYHLAVVVDDAGMGITHVIRGEDHISNTPRQILIQEALGIERPEYAHIPLILAPDRSKMSKRAGAVSLGEYRTRGFLPEALINYLALLGWNPGGEKELFSRDELVEAFDLGGVQKAGAIFNIEKLKWFNKEYLNKLSYEEQKEGIALHAPELAALPQFDALVPLLLERIAVFEDVRQLVDEGEFSFLFGVPQIANDELTWKDESLADAHTHLRVARERIAGVSEKVSAEEARTALWEYAEQEGKGSVLWPLRYALTGQKKSPDPFVVIALLGREEALTRIDRVLTASA